MGTPDVTTDHNKAPHGLSATCRPMSPLLPKGGNEGGRCPFVQANMSSTDCVCVLTAGWRLPHLDVSGQLGGGQLSCKLPKSGREPATTMCLNPPVEALGWWREPARLSGFSAFPRITHCLATAGCVDCTAWPQRHTSPPLTPVPAFALRYREQDSGSPAELPPPPSSEFQPLQ